MTENDKLEVAAKLADLASDKPVEEGVIFRAVASSTAIETGQSVLDIERKLKEAEGKYRDLKLGR